LGKVHQIAKTVTNAVKQAVNAEGIAIVQQNGRAANQDIFHLHVHIIPKYTGQKIKPFQELPTVDHKQLETTATKIRSHIEKTTN
jgi:histidine triad (HIT) family protein